MTQEDLARIEAELGVKLPAPYRRTLLQPASALGQPQLDEPELSLDAGRIVENTRVWREAQRPWPPTLVYIGDDGGEEAYFLDITEDPSPVLVYSHETGKIEREAAPDIDTYVTSVQQLVLEAEEDKRTMNERYQRKRWWEFWIRPYPG